MLALETLGAPTHACRAAHRHAGCDRPGVKGVAQVVERREPSKPTAARALR